ncbi:uncharacterized protein [Atheta coriaria]|uniref:uncharacterized protein n=1 Tax=Dalotia coriaria TaxID=877792 RepID=UPI0031F4726B
MICHLHEEPERWGTVYSLTNGTGMRFSIATGKADVAFGSMLPKLADRINGQILDSTLRCNVQFLVPHPEPISDAKYVIIPFTTTVWIVCIAFYLFIVIITYLKRRKEKKALNAKVDVSKVFLVIFRILIQQPTKATNKLLLFLIFGSMVLCIYYSSTFSSLIIKPIYNNHLKNSADVIKANNIKIISADSDYKDIIEKKSLELEKVSIG